MFSLQKIIPWLLIAMAIYCFLLIWSDFQKIQDTLQLLPWHLPFTLTILTLANYSLRYLKWHFYLQILKIKIPHLPGLLIYLSGLSMAISPGKIGELLKAYLIKKNYQIPVETTIAAVFADRLTDFLALAILSLFGAVFFNESQLISIIIFSLLAGLIIIFLNRQYFSFLWKLERLPLLGPRLHQIHKLLNNSHQLLILSKLIPALILSTISWSFEALGLFLIFQSLPQTIDYTLSVFIFSLSTIIGALSFLPGGLGFTEGSMTSMLITHSIPKNHAILATIIIRLFTLWLAVIIGLAAYWLHTYYYTQPNSNKSTTPPAPIANPNTPPTTTSKK